MYKIPFPAQQWVFQISSENWQHQVHQCFQGFLDPPITQYITTDHQFMFHSGGLYESHLHAYTKLRRLHSFAPRPEKEENII